MLDDVTWIETRGAPIDHDGPVDVRFEPFRDEWIEGPLIARFEAQADLHPDKLAIDDGRTNLTYAEARRAMHALAAEIDAVAPPGGVLAAVLTNTAAFPVAILASLASGRPLIAIDAAYPEARKAAILQESGVGALLLGEGVEVEEGLVPAGTPRIVARLQTDADVTPPTPKRSRWGVDGMAFTSGSTGRPKGVAYQGRVFLASVAEFTNSCHINADDRVLSLATLSVGGLLDSLTALYNGASVRICDLATQGLSEALRILRDEQITILNFIPLVVRTMMQAPGSEGAWASLRILNLYGDRVLASDVELFHRMLPPTCFVRVSLGSMETGSIFHGFVTPASLSEGASTAPCGRLTQGKAVLILGEDGRPAPPGEEGELLVRSAEMALGAWQDGQLVQGAFLPDPQDGSRRVYNTGDLVRLRADGVAEHVGRRDRRIKVRGLRADPTDVETVLRSYPGVQDAVVLARPLGEEAVFIAYLQAADPQATPSAEHIHGRAAQDLPAHMAPLEVHFLPAIPRLPNLKPDLMLLRRRDAEAAGAAAPAPEPVIRAAPAPAPDPRLVARVGAATERAWAAILGPAALRGRWSFAAAAGDSLKALQLMLHIEAALGVPAPLDLLAADTTPDLLAAALQKALAQPDLRDDPRPLVFFLPGMGGDEPSCAHLRQRLADRWRFVVLAYPGLERPAAEVGDLGAITSDALEQIGRWAPSGPVRLVGYSLGGALALEVAGRLAAAGRTPEVVCAVDSPLHATPQTRGVLRQEIGRARHGGAGWMVQYGLVLTLLRLRRFETARRFILAFRILFGAHRAVTAHNLLVGALRVQATGGMGRAIYPGPAALLRATRSWPDAADDLGWSAACPHLSVTRVEGDHHSILSDAHLPATADALADALRGPTAVVSAAAA